MDHSHNHPSQPVTFKDTGLPYERLWSPILNVNMKPAGQGGPKKSKGSKRKIGRNHRWNYTSHTETKYMASGGPARRQARIRHAAERRIMRTNRRHERFLKAAEERAERLG